MQNLKIYKIKPEEQKKLYQKLGLNTNKRSFNIKHRHFKLIKQKLLNNQQIKETNISFINFSIKLKNYKCFRNINGYPSRGQRTHTNAKTKKKFKFKSTF
jgi:ribosomal protein S13